MAQEHQEYIQSKVNPILESLVTEVLLERPDNPVPFMVRWLSERSKGGKECLLSLSVGEAERLRSEIRQLQEEIAILSKQVQTAHGDAEAKPSAGREGQDASEEEEEDDEEEEEIKPPPASYLQKGARTSVSAEAYGQWNQMKEFVPPVHPKSEEQESRIKSVLQKSFLFNTLDKKSVDVIVGAMLERNVEAGERIIQEGDDGNVMFLIESGTFNCIKKIGGEDKVVKKCCQGDVFGELALLYNCPRAASVEAVEAAVLWQLDRESFNHMVRDAAVKRREMYTEFLKSVPLLESLQDYDRMQIADCLTRQTVEAGTFVITQGDQGDRFYLVEEGKLVAQRTSPAGDVQEVKNYERGDYFGELALIRSEARAASVVAKTEATVVYLTGKEFKSLLGSLQETLHMNAKEYA